MCWSHYLILQLLEPGRYIWLFKALYGLLMLLPQVSANNFFLPIEKLLRHWFPCMNGMCSNILLWRWFLRLALVKILELFLVFRSDILLCIISLFSGVYIITTFLIKPIFLFQCTVISKEGMWYIICVYFPLHPSHFWDIFYLGLIGS